MSMSEAGFPHFATATGHPEFKSNRPWEGARLTTAGIYRMFPITIDSPHEPWCLHFEWGACNCGPRPDEQFVED